MKRLAFIALLALGLFAAIPARASFSLIRFADGHCEIWLDSFAPWAAGWTTLAITPDWWSAQVARDYAIARRVCIL